MLLQYSYTCIITQNTILRLRHGIFYRLVGAVIHQSLHNNCGHYTSYFLDHNQNQWFFANDVKVWNTMYIHTV